jgi:hypothetical protein
LPNSNPASPRAGLTEPRAIIARMAEDLNDLRREQGSVTQPSLMARGWTSGQLRKHYLAALEEAVRTYSETKAEPIIIGVDLASGPDKTVYYDPTTGNSGPYNPAHPQNDPFESFDASMRRQMANFEELQGCDLRPVLEGEA